MRSLANASSSGRRCTLPFLEVRSQTTTGMNTLCSPKPMSLQRPHSFIPICAMQPNSRSTGSFGWTLTYLHNPYYDTIDDSRPHSLAIATALLSYLVDSQRVLQANHAYGELFAIVISTRGYIIRSSGKRQRMKRPEDSTHVRRRY